MCSIDDTGENTCFISNENIPNLNEDVKCLKCSNHSVRVLLRKKDAYCVDCFIQVTMHKMRSSLGKSKKMHKSDRVLLALSGSPSSLALLHMLWLSKGEDQHKRLYFDIVCCYIDEGPAFGSAVEERLKIIAELGKYVESLNFTFHWTTLSRCLDNASTLFHDKFITSEDSKLQRLFEETKSNTAKEDLLHRLRSELLVRLAVELNCNKMFTAENQTELAIKLLTSVALGRGEQLSSEVGFNDERYSELMIIRPFVQVDSKEIAYYNKISSQPSFKRFGFTTKMSSNSSIRKATENFIVGLQSSFKSTVSTIYRTGDKLKTVRKGEDADATTCSLCHGAMLTDAEESVENIETATLASKRSKQAKSQFDDDDCRRCCESSEPCQEDGNSSFQLQLLGAFCYGCKLILRDMDSLDHLPPAILEEANQRSSLLAMREQIADFLL